MTTFAFIRFQKLVSVSLFSHIRHTVWLQFAPYAKIVALNSERSCPCDLVRLQWLAEPAAATYNYDDDKTANTPAAFKFHAMADGQLCTAPSGFPLPFISALAQYGDARKAPMRNLLSRRHKYAMEWYGLSATHFY